MACVRLSWSFTLITAIHIWFNLSKVCSNSYFDIRINSFTNDAKVDNIGECCTGGFSVDTKQCNSSICRTFFQICLTNYQADLPSSPECTFGRQVTPVIGENTFNDSFQNGFENPIRIPMEFEWLGDFSLIIEAMHDVSGMHVEEGSERKLLSRLTMTDAIDASATWTNFTHADENHTLEFSCRVVCKAGRYGPRCATGCTPRDDYFTHYTCDSDGNKVCLDGWTGLRCDDAVCDGCENGNCPEPNQCACQAGWTGERCDECIPHPSCINGFCYEAAQCICDPGWRGIFCDYDATFCTENNPCRNGGTCVHTDSGSGYECNCPAGISGSHCEIVDLDDSCDCENGGTCRYVDDGVKVCDCQTGFSGERCEEEATCPCVNGGTCQMINDGYICLCPAGYFGTNCEHYNDCLSVETPCQNGGTCLDGKDSYSCGCPAGFIGDYCETNICADNPCQNGGTCNGQADGMRCDCPIGYSGTHCETVDNSCLLQPCANGGICYNLENDFRCNCPEGFGSKDCSVNINECGANLCNNGATCKDLVNDFECICAPGWFGELCDDHVTTFIISATLPNDEQPTLPNDEQSTHVLRDSTKDSPLNDLQTDNDNQSATDLKLILIYCFCGVLIVLIIILLCIIVYRKKHVHNDAEKGPCNIEPNNKKTYTDNFSQKKKVLPLSSISIKVCNEESDSYSKGTSKQFSTFKDYEKDIYSQKVLQENADSLSEKLSRHSYQKKIPERRKSIEICQSKVESSTVQITAEIQETKESKQINSSDNSTLLKGQNTKAQYLATQV